MDVPEYRVWMYNRLGPKRVGLTEEFYNGVEEFIQFACANNADFPSTGTIRCPCVKCKCTKFKVLDEVRRHLYKVGFQPRYYYWTAHGEVQDQFIDPRSATMNDSIINLKEMSNQASTFDTDGCEQQPIDQKEIFLQVAGGMSKKGRVYGLGSKARCLRASSSASSYSGRFRSHSQKYFLQQEIEKRVDRMNAELRDIVDSQQQHIVEQDRKLEAMDRKLEAMDRKLEAMERMIASQQQYFARMGIQPQPPTDDSEGNREAYNEDEDDFDDIDSD